MNLLEKLKLEKLTENGDKSYTSTGNNNIDLVFLAEYLSKHLKEASIGTSDKEKLLAMFIRDPRFGLGYKDLGRRLLAQAKVSPELILESGRADDLWQIASDECLKFLYEEAKAGNNLVKKWLPSNGSGHKDKAMANALMKEWGLTPKEYRQLKKTDSTVEYKLTYHEVLDANNPLEEVCNEREVVHPLVDSIDFEKVPSLATHKYIKTFATRDDIKERYSEYISKVKEGKAKVNTSTANVYNAYKTASKVSTLSSVQEASEVISKKTIEDNIAGVALNCLVVLDSSGSMGSGVNSLMGKALSVAHALSTCSTYCPNELITFSANPRFIKIPTETSLENQYKLMMDKREAQNTDFGKVMNLCSKLSKFPEYIVCLSDMEFDEGSRTSYYLFNEEAKRKHKEDIMKDIRDKSPNTKIIWWNFNDRNSTSPELDEYGNIFLSGYNLQILKFLEAGFDMTMFLNKLLEEYKKNINNQLKKNGRQEIS